MKNKKGFTLVELLVVIAILAVIVLIATPIIISNINSSKEKSYNNQIISFKKGAERYALEYNNDLNWETIKVDDIEYEKAYVTLEELSNKRYVNLPVMNPVTGEEFDPKNTKVTIYREANGNLQFYYEDESSFRIVNNISTQYILKGTVYDYMNDIYVVDSSNKNITSSVNINTTCTYNNEIVDCNVLKNADKELGSYLITYNVSKGEVNSISTRTVVVVEQQSPIITIRPDTENKVDNVRVFIEYPAGSTENKYTSTRTGTSNYRGAFDVDRNQTITATCRDKYGLACKSVEKQISNIRPTIEGNISIAVDWPNTTSFDIDISGVTVVKGNGTLEYKCKVGNTVVDWNSSSNCKISGLTSGQAYTVEVYVRDSKEKDYVIETKPTVYTSKVVAQTNSTASGTCPSSTNVAVSGDAVYPSATLTGSCSQTYSTAKVSSKITNSTACGAGATLTYSYSGKTYSSTTTSTCSATSSKCNSSTSYYACSVSSYSSSGCSSLSYYACSRSSYSSSGCSSLSYYACSVSSYSASGCSTTVCKNYSYYCASSYDYGCAAVVCTEYKSVCDYKVSSCCNYANVCMTYGSGGACLSTSNSCVNPCSKCIYKDSCVSYSCVNYDRGCLVSGSTCTSTSTTYTGCSVRINSSSGCSQLKYSGCSVRINSSSGCSQLKYSGCSVLISSASGCSKGVCNGYTSYYTTDYSANIKFPSSYTISYSSVIIKPKQSLYN